MVARAIFILLVFCGCVFTGYSQDLEIQKSTKIEKIDGKQYYIHTVEKGQTLYSISKAYDVLISEIIFENPLALEGIQPGAELKIIAKSEAGAKSPQPAAPAIEGNFVLHHVEPRETLYSLARQYEVSVDDIKNANGDLLNEGLRIGLTIKIPIKNLLDEESSNAINTAAPVHRPINRDTVFAPGMKKASYSVCYMLPLFLDANDTISARANNMEPDNIYEESLSGFEFWQGAQLALDSLKKNGLSADVYVYDTENSVSKVRNLFSKPEVKSADLVIGPFYQNLFTTAQQFSEANHTALISPVMTSSEPLAGKPYTVRITASEETEMREMARYISSKYCAEKILVIHKGKEDELKRLKWFKSGFGCDSLHQFSEINYKSAGWDSLSTILVRADTNIVVVLSNDQSFVTSFFITLDKRKREYPMKVFGISSWREFENIETDYYHDLNLHLPAQHVIDYQDAAVVGFIKNYRERFKNEPGYYAYLGFDLTYYFLSTTQKFGAGNNYLDKLGADSWSGLQARYRLERKKWEMGLENRASYIVQYKDYKLQKVN